MMFDHPEDDQQVGITIAVCPHLGVSSVMESACQFPSSVYWMTLPVPIDPVSVSVKPPTIKKVFPYGTAAAPPILSGRFADKEMGSYSLYLLPMESGSYMYKYVLALLQVLACTL